MTAPQPCLSAVDVAVLAGGLGTRVSGVLGGTPKVLASIAGRPYLDRLLEQLARFGARRVVLCLGHLADRVIAHLAGRPADALPRVEWVVETEPLGTGGALRLAAPQLGSDPVMVMNGDTWLAMDACAFLDRFRASAASVGLACVSVDDAGRYGAVDTDADGRVTRFREKRPGTGPGAVSAGVYLFSQAALARLRETSATSLERDFLQLQPAGTIAAWRTDAAFVDIGTPESLAAAADTVTGGAGATRAGKA